MMRCNVVLSLLGLAAASTVNMGDKQAPLKEFMPWYHSADEIHNKLQELTTNCKGADLQLEQRTEINSADAAGQVVTLDVVHISRSGGSPKSKAMMIFGEHARELISPESGLNFVQTLCGNGPDADRASKVLDSTSFTIVPNANPISRKRVEDGYYCQRTNEDGVDLNRNFGDDHRVAGGDQKQLGDEQYPGPSGFSEPESKLIKGLIDEERPEIYLSIHSGAYLLGTPYGYTSGQTPPTEQSMMEVLGPISKKYCGGECPYGNLAELINYENPGCDIDYVADHAGSEYVFTWEIYVGETFRERYIDEAKMRSKEASLLALNSKSKRLRGGRKMRKRSKIEEVPPDKGFVDSCIEQFNPQSAEETASVVARWTGAYLELAEEVAKKKNATAAAAAKEEQGAATSNFFEAPSDKAATDKALDAWPALSALDHEGSSQTAKADLFEVKSADADPFELKPNGADAVDAFEMKELDAGFHLSSP